MNGSAPVDLKRYIRDIPDFPKPGILFRDITPLLADAAAFRESVRRLAAPFREQRIDAIVAAEARGFIFAAPLAIELSTGFVPVRKPGKLPYDRHSHHYTLEYGTDSLEGYLRLPGCQEVQKVRLSSAAAGRARPPDCQRC